MREVNAMLEDGFMETTDVDRLNIQLEQARTQQRNFVQQAEVARLLLALTLGLPQGTPMTLTDDLTKILHDADEIGLTEQPLTARTWSRTSRDPGAVARSEPQERTHQGHAFTGCLPQPPAGLERSRFRPGRDLPFFPTTVWGAKLTVPIFSSGNRHHKVKQAEIALSQVEVNRTATEQRLLATAEQSRSQARTAFDNFRTEERNLGLSKNIFDRTSIKFTNGSAASFELTQEQGNYLIAQQTYIQRMVELLMARADLRKALDLY
ncbi:MAG: TolC family protein [Flavobacteriales bacterium]|nr:TolC family protein [Flavobacteriales bacterium]